MAALAGAWNTIRAQHLEVPPVVLVIGPPSRANAKWRRLGHFSPLRWSPLQKDGSDELEVSTGATREAIERGDMAALSAALRVSGEAILRAAQQLSRDAKDSLGEVLITEEGLTLSATELLEILLHEGAHGVAFERGVKDTSRQGRYHNGRFKTIAAELGLEVDCELLYGWCRTTLPAATAARYETVLTGLASTLPGAREGSGVPSRRRGIRTIACECGQRVRGRSGFVALAAICSSCTGCSRTYAAPRRLAAARS